MLFGQPWLDEREIEAVADVLRSGWISQGPKVAEFEEALKQYLGADEVVAVSSCTAALHLALLSCGLKPGDKVLVPTFTFVATANIVTALGLEIEFADCNPETLNIELPDTATCSFYMGVKAVLPVHFAGRPCDLSFLETLAHLYEWKIVEDAAHAFGASYEGKMIGTSGNPVCFSFYPNKNLTTIEGGAISLVGKDAAGLAQRFRVERMHGLSSDAWRRFDSSNIGVSLMERLGFKYNMTDVQAAIGLVQLKKFDEMQARRWTYWEMYMTLLQGLPFRLPVAYAQCIKSSPHLFIIIHTDGKRNELRQYLSKQGIPTGIHYIPVHQHPYYRIRYPNVSCPVAESIGQRCLSLPLSAAMSKEEVANVCAAVRRFYEI